MKKTGTLLTWALNGLIAQTLFVFLASALFAIQFTQVEIITQTIIAVWSFVTLRILMDWKMSDNKIEDHLRETYLDQTWNSQFLFAFYSAFLLVLSNVNVWPITTYALVLGIPVFFVVNTGFLFVRNFFFLTKVAPNGQGVNEHG